MSVFKKRQCVLMLASKHKTIHIHTLSCWLVENHTFASIDVVTDFIETMIDDGYLMVTTSPLMKTYVVTMKGRDQLSIKHYVSS